MTETENDSLEQLVDVMQPTIAQDLMQQGVLPRAVEKGNNLAGQRKYTIKLREWLGRAASMRAVNCQLFLRYGLHTQVRTERKGIGWVALWPGENEFTGGGVTMILSVCSYSIHSPGTVHGEWRDVKIP